MEMQSKQKRVISAICPICKTKLEIELAESILNHDGSLTCLSIQKNTACPHHFQVFVDEDFIVRGYQIVDFSIDPDYFLQGFELDEKIDLH